MASDVLSKTVGALTARNWISGEWVEAKRRLESINSATGEVTGTYADGGARQAELAISAESRARQLHRTQDHGSRKQLA